jgi:hypothetical protein
MDSLGTKFNPSRLPCGVMIILAILMLLVAFLLLFWLTVMATSVHTLSFGR